MSIPKIHEIMDPLLRYLNDYPGPHQFRDVVEKMADFFSLSREEQGKLLSNGYQTSFANRLGWARTYLKKAGYVISPQRGYMEITEEGQQALRFCTEKIDYKYLRENSASYQEYYKYYRYS